MKRSVARQLAWRYMRGKGSANAVPILSRISMVAIAVASGAMIIVFSAFNGFDHLVKDMYKTFYPDIRISATKGKFFSIDKNKLSAIAHTEGVHTTTRVIEDNALAISNDQQKIVTLKGIENSYFDVNDVRPYMMQGVDSISTGNSITRPTAITGDQIAKKLATDVHNVFSELTLKYPNANNTNPALDPVNAYQSLTLNPIGIFRVDGGEFDDKYVLAPLSLVQTLFRSEGKYSSIEVSTDNTQTEAVKTQLQKLLGSGFKIETRYEQNKTLYMVMGTEKWAVYIILLLVLLIASFNMIGALAMLVMEKQKDIAILKAMGATLKTIRRIFIFEGLLWSLTGGLSGLALGALLCFLQQTFGFVKINGGNGFLVPAYPVSMELPDFLLIIATIMVVGLLAAWYPAIRATRTEDPTLKGA